MVSTLGVTPAGWSAELGRPSCLSAEARNQQTVERGLSDRRYFPDVSPALRQDDPRLDRNVQILTARATLGDLLKEISDQTGVAVTIGDSPRGAANTELCALLRQSSVAKTINGLLSLMSYQHAKWSLRRTHGTDGSYQYNLLPSAALPDLVNELRDKARLRFIDEAAKLRAVLAMTPDEQLAARRNDSDAESLCGEPPDGRRHVMLSAFFSLPESEQNDILGGAGPVTVALSLFPPEVRMSVEKLMGSGGLSTEASPTLTFDAQAALGTAPMLMVGVTGFGMSNCIGGRQREAEADSRFDALWRLIDDDAARTHREEPLERPNPAMPFIAAYNNDWDLALETLLWRTAEAAPVDVLALLPHSLPLNFALGGSGNSGTTHSEGLGVVKEPPYGQTLSFVIASVDRSARLKSKWRDGILLFRDPASPF